VQPTLTLPGSSMIIRFWLEKQSEKEHKDVGFGSYYLMFTLQVGYKSITAKWLEIILPTFLIHIRVVSRVFWYVIRVFKSLCVVVNFSRPFMWLISIAEGRRGGSCRCCGWSSTRQAANWNCDGQGLHTASSPSTSVDQTNWHDSCWIQGRPH
jgi:hypothetical protein